MKNILTKKIGIIADNGGNPHLPPATASALDWASREKVDMLSLYLHMTADDIIIAAPAEEMKNYCTLDGSIEDFNYDEIASLEFKDESGALSEERLLTIEEILNSYSHMPLNLQLIDFNETGVKKLCKSVLEAQAVENVIICSMQSKIIKKVRKLLPEAATACSLKEIMVIFALFRAGLLGLKKKYAADCLQIPEKIGTSYIANKGLIKKVRERGLKVYVWGVNSAEMFNRVKKTGADGFFTADFLLMKKLIKNNEM